MPPRFLVSWDSCGVGAVLPDLIMSSSNEELETAGHEYPVGEPTLRGARARVNKLVLPAPSKPRMGPLLVACITACNESYEELQVR